MSPRRSAVTVKFKMSEHHPGPDHYDPVSFPGPAPPGEPRRPAASSRWLQRSVIAIPLALVLIPALWGFLPGEIVRWHDAAAKEKYLEGDVPGAIAELDVAISKNNGSVERFALRAKYRHELGHYADSLEDWNAALELRPEGGSLRLRPSRLDLLLERAKEYQHLNKHQEAIADYRAVQKQVSEETSLFGDLARGSVINGISYARGVGNCELKEGLAGAQEVVKLLGGDAFVLEQTGYLHILRKDWKRAKTRLEEAALAFSNEIETLKRLTEHSKDKGSQDNAQSLMRKSEDRLVGVQFHLARVCRELNEAEEAAKYEKLVAAWGKPEKSLRDLLPSLRVSWEIVGNLAMVIDTRGYLYYRLGDYISARRDLEFAAEVFELDYQRKDERFKEERMAINDLRAFELKEVGKKRNVAVVVYHRALIYQRLGLTDFEAEDLRRVKEVYGVTPGDDLF